MPPVDPETGEILIRGSSTIFHPIPEEEWIEPEIILPQAELEFPELEDGSDDEDVQVDFSAKELFEYKLPSLQLFAPDKPKTSRRKRRLFEKISKSLEETFASFGIKVTVGTG